MLLAVLFSRRLQVDYYNLIPLFPYSSSHTCFTCSLGICCRSPKICQFSLRVAPHVCRLQEVTVQAGLCSTVYSALDCRNQWNGFYARPSTPIILRAKECLHEASPARNLLRGSAQFIFMRTSNNTYACKISHFPILHRRL